MSKSINDSLSTAFAPARMEGFQITPKIEADCRKLVSGELSIQDYISQVTAVGASTTRESEYVIQP